MADRIVFIGTTSSDVIDLRSEGAAYEIYARKGNDLVFGTAFDDVIAGEQGHDDLFGGDGNDVFLVSPASTGDDRYDGGAGDDVIRGDDADNVIRLRGLSVGQSIEQIDGGGGRNIVAGTLSGDKLDFSGTVLINIDLIDGDKGNDVITGTIFNDRIMGGRGYDRLYGGGGLDTAIFSGSVNNYEITIDGDRVTVKDLVGTDATDELTGFSYLQFSDTIVDLTGGTGGTPPEALADNASVPEDTPVTINVLANDSGTDGNALAVAAVTQGANGSVTINPDNTVTYTPRADFFGTDSFTYTVSSGPLNRATATVTVTVCPQPDAPLAQNDEVSTTVGTPVVINVLGNDSDPDGDSLALVSFTQPAIGTVTQNADGTLTYSPASGFSGSDAFTYAVTDQTVTSSATVFLEVAPPRPSLEGLSFRQILTAISENEWVRVNLSHFQDVWTPFEHRALGGNRKPAPVIGAWASMAWDSERGDLIFWGGGHANYPGNEIYRWRSSTLDWERASLPSEVMNIEEKRYEAIDGYLNAPISSHTYDNSEYLPIADRFITFGGAAWNTGGPFVRTDGLSKTGPYFWDPSKADASKVGGTTGSHVNPELFPDVVGGEMWENRDNLNLAYLAGFQRNLVQGTSAYAQENGKDVIYFGRNDLWKYTVNDVNDPASDTYQKVGSYSVSFGGHGAGAISTDLNVYLRTASNTLVMWDLNEAGPKNKNVNFVPDDPSGRFDFANLHNHGMDYDPVRGIFVLWNGDGEVWALTPPDEVSTTGWTLTPLTPGTANELPNTSTNEVLGKWKYAAEQDIFLGVNDSVNGDVWLYKPNDWQPSNTLPELHLANISELALQPGDLMSLTDLIDWSDADGDTLHFGFTDLNLDPSSGYFVLGGETQSAGHEITVSANRVVLGDLLWVMGEAGQSDDIAMRVSDPFGSSAISTVRLPADPSSALAGLVSADGDGLSLATASA